MREKGRLHKSMSNMLSGFAYRLIITVTAFVVRTVFISCLNEEYLGVNGLYTNILSLLSLAELGFGTAMVYSLYDPLSKKDYIKLQQLMHLYKKVYTIVGTVVLVLGLCIFPFLDYFVKEKPDIAGVEYYYLLFLFNTVLSYWFFAYRSVIFQADQKAYIVTKYQIAFNLIKSVCQIIILYQFRNFTLYLLTQMACTIIQNILLSNKAHKEYPVFKKNVEMTLPIEETKKIFKDVKALFLARVSFVFLNSSDTLIMSKLMGLGWVGYISNYMIVIEAITGVLSQITSAMTASIGNYFVEESRDKGYDLFCKIDFLNYWLYGFSVIALTVLLDPFVDLWLGEKFVLGRSISLALAIRFGIAGFVNHVWMFRSTLGLFVQGKTRPLVVAGINVVLSVILGLKLGAFGIIIATPIARMCGNVWYDPWVLHRQGFAKPIKPFVTKYIIRVCILVVTTLLMCKISNMILATGVTYIRFILVMGLVAIIPNIIFMLVFHRTSEYMFFLNIIKKAVMRID